MSGNLPEMLMVRSREPDAPVVLAEDTTYNDMAALLAAYPDLASGNAATTFAQAVNHFAQGNAFAVITDPDAFEAAYREQLAGEDASEPWQQGVYQLSSYGVPDFSAIHPPAVTGGSAVFFVADDLIGVPYRVEASLDGTLPEDSAYVPLPLTEAAPGLTGTRVVHENEDDPDEDPSAADDSEDADEDGNDKYADTDVENPEDEEFL